MRCVGGARGEKYARGLLRYFRVTKTGYKPYSIEIDRAPAASRTVDIQLPREEPTQSVTEPSGIWVGRLTMTDRHGTEYRYNMRVDFDKKEARMQDDPIRWSVSYTRDNKGGIQSMHMSNSPANQHDYYACDMEDGTLTCTGEGLPGPPIQGRTIEEYVRGNEDRFGCQAVR